TAQRRAKETIGGRREERAAMFAAPSRGAAPLLYRTSTLMTFVEPGMLTAVPAVITTVSPDSIRPASFAASIERFQRSSTSLHSGIQIGVTPHSIAIWCTDHCLCVSATIGRRGRRRA